MIEIYGTDNCTFCDKAKQLLQKYEKEYTYINVTETEDMTAAFFKKFPDVRTVPQVTLDDEFHIGGYQELEKWLNHTE
jgi:glutaredoxin